MQIGPYKRIGPTIPTLWGDVPSPFVQSAPSLLRQPMFYPSIMAEHPNPNIPLSGDAEDAPQGNYVPLTQLSLVTLPHPRTVDPTLNLAELKRILLEARRVVLQASVSTAEISAVAAPVDTALGLIDRLVSNGVSYDHLVAAVIEQSYVDAVDDGLDGLRQQLVDEVHEYLDALALMKKAQGMITAPPPPPAPETTTWPWFAGGLALAAIGYYFWRK